MKSKQKMIYMMKGGETVKKVTAYIESAFQLSKRNRKQYRKIKIKRIIKSFND